MTRVKISAAIIIILAAVSVFSGIWVNGRCREMMAQTDKAAELFSQGSSDEAVAAAQELQREWESFRSVAAVLLHNDKLSEIDRLCARATGLADSQSEEFVSELTEIKHLLDMLRNGEIPKWNSVF